MLPSELVKKIKMIQLRASHLAKDVLSGEYISAFKGQGMEFDEVREYMPGDDVRAIDWNVTARMNQPFIKRFREEREMTIILAVDVSPSLIFGSTGKEKREIAAEFAAVIALLAVQNNDKVGLLLFSDHVENFIPPKKGRGHVWNIIKQVLTYKGFGKTTKIATALDHIMLTCKRKSLCFLVSDFIADDYEKVLKSVSKRHDLVCVDVKDPREWNLANVGIIELRDIESNANLLVDTSSLALRNHFVNYYETQAQSLNKFCRKQNMDKMNLSTDGDLVQALISFLKNRERRRVVK